jgi:hypothetical protein
VKKLIQGFKLFHNELLFAISFNSWSLSSVKEFSDVFFLGENGESFSGEVVAQLF